MRKKIVAGNWKMNCTFEEGQTLTSEIVNMIKDERKKDVTVVLNPPFVHIPSVKRLIGETADLFVGAQNCSSKESGAYTGEVSAKFDPCFDFPDSVVKGIRTSVGFGFRWFSPIGPLRFEWGIPLDRQENEEPLVFEFTIGNFF